MLSWTDAENRKGSSVTSAICWRSEAGSTDRTSAPSTSTDPAIGSYSRGISETSVVLPDAVGPTSATVVPAGTSSDTSRKAGEPAPSYRTVTSRSSTWPAPSGSGGASSGTSIAGGRSRIWKIRRPDAVARCAIPSATPSVRIGEISMSR